MKERVYSEVRINHFDDVRNVWCVDAWKTADDMEEGVVVATISPEGEVTYNVPEAADCPEVTEEIEIFLGNEPDNED